MENTGEKLKERRDLVSDKLSEVLAGKNWDSIKEYSLELYSIIAAMDLTDSWGE